MCYVGPVLHCLGWQGEGREGRLTLIRSPAYTNRFQAIIIIIINITTNPKWQHLPAWRWRGMWDTHVPCLCSCWSSQNGPAGVQTPMPRTGSGCTTPSYPVKHKVLSECASLPCVSMLLVVLLIPCHKYFSQIMLYTVIEKFLIHIPVETAVLTAQQELS